MLDASQCPPTVTVEATLTPHHATATATDQHWQTWQHGNSQIQIQMWPKTNEAKCRAESNGNGNVMEIAVDLAVDRMEFSMEAKWKRLESFWQPLSRVTFSAPFAFRRRPRAPPRPPGDMLYKQFDKFD